MSDRADAKLRELAYRLIQMSPEAPPFPEEDMVQLRPSPTRSAPPPRRRRSPLVLAGAAALLVLLVVGAPLLLDRLSSDEVTGPVTTGPDTVAPTTPPTVPVSTTVTPEPAVPTNVTLYFVDGAGAVTPTAHVVDAAPDAHSKIAASLEALFGGVTSDDEAIVPGVTSAIPAGTSLPSLTTDLTDSAVGTVEVAVGDQFAGVDRTAIAQIVYTVTQFAGIDTVSIVDATGDPVVVADGTVLDQPLTRADLVDTLPPVFLDWPPINGVVSSPFTLTGVATNVEGELGYELVDTNGTVIAAGFIGNACGADCSEGFSAEAAYELNQVDVGSLAVFTTAPDGTRSNEVRHLLTIEAAPGGDGVAAPYELYSDTRGGPPLDGSFVVESPITVYGNMSQGPEVRINGNTYPVTDGSFEAVIELAPGVNELFVEDGEINVVYTVTYLPGGTVEFSYLDRVGPDEMVADYAQWLSGEEANQAAFEDGVISSVDEGVPNDYYIRNVNPQLRTLPVASNVKVFLVTSASGSVTTIPVPLDEWLALHKPDGTPWDPDAGDQLPELTEPHYGYFGAGSPTAPYWLTLDADGTVVQISQQYIP